MFLPIPPGVRARTGKARAYLAGSAPVLRAPTGIAALARNSSRLAENGKTPGDGTPYRRRT
jgi:hypothetical protein